MHWTEYYKVLQGVCKDVSQALYTFTPTLILWVLYEESHPGIGSTPQRQLCCPKVAPWVLPFQDGYKTVLGLFFT